MFARTKTQSKLRITTGKAHKFPLHHFAQEPKAPVLSLAKEMEK